MIDPSLIASGLAGALLAIAGSGTLTAQRRWRLRLGFAYARYSTRTLLLVGLTMLGMDFVFGQPMIGDSTSLNFPCLAVAVGNFGVVLVTLIFFRQTIPCTSAQPFSLRNEGNGTVSLHLNHPLDAERMALRWVYPALGSLIKEQLQELSVFGVRRIVLHSYLLVQRAPSGEAYQRRATRIALLAKSIGAAIPTATIELLPLGRTNWRNSLYLRLRMLKINSRFPWRAGICLPATGMVVAL